MTIGRRIKDSCLSSSSSRDDDDDDDACMMGVSSYVTCLSVRFVVFDARMRTGHVRFRASVRLSVCVEVKQSYTRVVRQRNARKLHAWFPSTQRTATNARKYATSATDAANGNNKNMQASSVRNERNERKKALCRRRVAYVSARPSACIRTLRTTSSDTTRVKLAYLTCLAKLSSQ